MALNTRFFNLLERVALGDRGVAFDALHPGGHHIRLRLLLPQSFSPDELYLSFMTVDAFRFWLVVTAQALHSRLVDLSVFLSSRMADITVQYPCNMFLMGKGKVINFDLGIFESLVTFGALGMRHLGRLWQWDGPPRMTF